MTNKPVTWNLARLLTLTATTYTCYACLWGLFYRKFFFDMIGGKLGPQGIIPNVKLNGLLTVIVKIPLLQILVLLLSAFIFLIVYPIKAFSIFTKNISFIITLLFLTGFLALGVYQAVDAGIYMFISAAFYAISTK